MRKITANYWGEEYLDAVLHEMGVGDGDESPELPPEIDVPDAVMPVVQKQYQELLANEAPDPKYFLQGVQITVADYFDGKVEPYTREADIIAILADGFATEEFFGWRGGSPDYSFWTMHQHEIADLSAAIGVDPDQLFDDLGKLAVTAAAEEGRKLTQEIRDAKAEVDEKIVNTVEENWTQPINNIIAMWTRYLDHEVENPRDVTVDELVAMVPDSDEIGYVHMDFIDVMDQVLPGLARQVLLAPDPRQTEIPFPKRRGRPQKHFYKKSSSDPTLVDDLVSDVVDAVHAHTKGKPVHVDETYTFVYGLVTSMVEQLPDDQVAPWGNRDDLIARVTNTAYDEWRRDLGRDLHRHERPFGRGGFGRGGNARRAASDDDLIERYLGTEGPEAFGSIEEIEEYFKPESLDYMFGPEGGHPDANEARVAVTRAWQQRHDQ